MLATCDRLCSVFFADDLHAQKISLMGLQERPKYLKKLVPGGLPSDDFGLLESTLKSLGDPRGLSEASERGL